MPFSTSFPANTAMSPTSSRLAPMARREGKATMPTLSAGATNRQSGVTLLELMVVVTLIAIVAGLSYPAAAAGVDSLRLRSAADRVVAFLDTSIERAERRQQVMEIRISP